jgi:hypothetical protein
MHQQALTVSTPRPALRSVDPSAFVIWTMIATSLAAYTAAMAGGLLRGIDPTSLLVLTAFVVPLLAGSYYYGRFRDEPRLARMLRGFAELLLLGSVTVPLSYATASMNLPLWDETFAAWDKALGFHWNDWLELLNGNPLIHAVLSAAYRSMIPQLFLVIAALATIRAFQSMDVLLVGFGISTWLCLSISAFTPALSPLVHFGITAAHHPNITLAVPPEFADHVRALRAGTFVADEMGSPQGIVTFPSFHTSTAIILILAFWRVSYLRWLSLVLNTLMLLSIPIEGSHYLVDVMAGAAVGIVAWTLAEHVCQRASNESRRWLGPVGTTLTGI